MGRNGFLAVLLLFFIAANVSDASFAGKFRKLLGLPLTDNATNTGNSGVPSTVSGGNDTITNPTVANKPIKEESNGTRASNEPSKADPKVFNNTGSGSSPIQKQKDSPTNNQEEEKNDTQNNTETETVGNCDGLPYNCTDKKMTACVQSFRSGLKEVVLLVQNEGESTLTVNITVPASAKNALKEDVEIPKHPTKRINISLTNVEGIIKIVVNTSNGDCVIHMDSPVSKGNISPRFPPYSELVNPIYGACFLFLTALIIGGSWACCKFRKKRQLGGVPYQELEMGMPAPVSAVDLETAEGWDQGWDDDWDEDKAVKSPGGRHVGNISGSGLTSRSFKKDGWENDWDD